MRRSMQGLLILGVVAWLFILAFGVAAWPPGSQPSNYTRLQQEVKELRNEVESLRLARGAQVPIEQLVLKMSDSMVRQGQIQITQGEQILQLALLAKTNNAELTVLRDKAAHSSFAIAKLEDKVFERPVAP